MNERIRELDKNVLASSENMRWNIENAEKFAKLFVRECFAQVREEVKYLVHDDPAQRREIRWHSPHCHTFGPLHYECAFRKIEDLESER